MQKKHCIKPQQNYRLKQKLLKEYLNNQEPISLRLSATLNSSGELVNFELIKSSGIETIDQVAIDILKTASPFIPFSEMMNDYLEITIIRDWNFGSPKI